MRSCDCKFDFNLYSAETRDISKVLAQTPVDVFSVTDGKVFLAPDLASVQRVEDEIGQIAGRFDQEYRSDVLWHLKEANGGEVLEPSPYTVVKGKIFIPERGKTLRAMTADNPDVDDPEFAAVLNLIEPLIIVPGSQVIFADTDPKQMIPARFSVLTHSVDKPGVIKNQHILFPEVSEGDTSNTFLSDIAHLREEREVRQIESGGKTRTIIIIRNKENFVTPEEIAMHKKDLVQVAPQVPRPQERIPESRRVLSGVAEITTVQQLSQTLGFAPTHFKEVPIKIGEFRGVMVGVGMSTATLSQMPVLQTTAIIPILSESIVRFRVADKVDLPRLDARFVLGQTVNIHGKSSKEVLPMEETNMQTASILATETVRISVGKQKQETVTLSETQSDVWVSEVKTDILPEQPNLPATLWVSDRSGNAAKPEKLFPPLTEPCHPSLELRSISNLPFQRKLESMPIKKPQNDRRMTENVRIANSDVRKIFPTDANCYVKNPILPKKAKVTVPKAEKTTDDFQFFVVSKEPEIVLPSNEITNFIVTETKSVDEVARLAEKDFGNCHLRDDSGQVFRQAQDTEQSRSARMTERYISVVEEVIANQMFFRPWEFMRFFEQFDDEIKNFGAKVLPKLNLEFLRATRALRDFHAESAILQNQLIFLHSLIKPKQKTLLNYPFLPVNWSAISRNLARVLYFNHQLSMARVTKLDVFRRIRLVKFATKSYKPTKLWQSEQGIPDYLPLYLNDYKD